jgi:hypothetical protein
MADYNQIRAALADACRTVDPSLRVYDYVPQSLVPPVVVVQARMPAIDYREAMSSGSAEWYFVVMYVVGPVNEQAAQARVGELISPGSSLISALNGVDLTNGYVMVTQGGVSEMQVGPTAHTYARLWVTVKA